MVKTTLLVALLYFVSPIAIASFEAKTINNEGPRQEFFHPAQIAASPESKTLPIQQVAKTEAPKTLCSGLVNSANTIPAFCAAYVPEANITLNDLESSGTYACEQIVQPELPMEAISMSDIEASDISTTSSLITLATNH